MPRARHALLADSVATTFGSMFGTSPTSAYIESSSGVAVGGRTGLTSLTVSILFIVAAFFGPLVSTLSGVSAITAPALIIVGSLMIGAVKDIDWDSFDEAFPAFLVILNNATHIKHCDRNRSWFHHIPTIKSCKRERETSSHPVIYFRSTVHLSAALFTTLKKSAGRRLAPTGIRRANKAAFFAE